MIDETGFVPLDSLIGRLSGPPREHLQKLCEDVRDHVGQYLLAVERSEEFQGCSMGQRSPSSEHYVLKTHFSLGVLASEKIIADPTLMFASFDTTGHMHVTATHRDKMPPEQQNRNLCVGYFGAISLIFINQPMICKNGWNAAHDPLALEIIAGDDAVEQWFRERRNSMFASTFDAMSFVLGRLNKSMGERLEKAREAEIAKLRNSLEGHEEAIKAILGRACELGLQITDPLFQRWLKFLPKAP